MKMKTIPELGDFVRRLRTQMRYGELSRAPLCLLRIEARGEAAECDWLARLPDVWDSTLPRNRGAQLASEQALRDAIGVSRLLFDSLPQIQEARFRAFRQSARVPPDLIITGKFRREAPSVMRVPSLVMRAKLHGLHFWLDDGVLMPLDEQGQRGLRLMGVG
ncbi:MAG: hypothetical protein WBQ34_05150 [Candidatus Acidiferrales bacterium]